MHGRILSGLIDGGIQEIHLLSKAQLGKELAGGAGSIGSCFLLVFLDELDLAGAFSTAFAGVPSIASASNKINVDSIEIGSEKESARLQSSKMWCKIGIL